MADLKGQNIQITSSAPIEQVKIPIEGAASSASISAATAYQNAAQDQAAIKTGAPANPPAKSPINPLDLKAKTTEDSQLIKNIVSAETTEQKAILGEAPELDTNLLQDIAPPKSVLLTVLKLTFGLLIVASIVSVLFFTSQLKDTFDFIAGKLHIPNASQELSSANAEIIKLQTDLNMYRYLEIKALLDKFSFDGDSFLRNFETANSQTVSENDKALAVSEMDTIKSKLRDTFMTLREKLAVKSSVPLIDTSFSDESQLEILFLEEIKNRLTQKAAEFINSDNPDARRSYKNYSHAVNLVGNQPLRDLVIATDFDSLIDEQLYGTINNINALIVNDLSIIQAVKNKRIRWSDIIQEIENRTIAVDTYYSGDFYDALGGIRYNSYDFDSEQRKINISGETKRFDTTNFTMIANLIDELNRSEIFENGEMRSFSKSGSLDEGYTATLKLTLDLQDREVAEAAGAGVLDGAGTPPTLDAPPTL